MKNIFITESQYNKIRESVFEKTQTKSIFGDKYSPLASIVSNEQVEKLLSKREIEVREIVQKLFNDNTIYSPHNISKEISPKNQLIRFPILIVLFNTSIKHTIDRPRIIFKI